jgi:MFS superfamily sulfate permease-like transporter
MRSIQHPDWLLRLLPFLRWWPRVDRGTLRADAIAGLTGGLVLVPQGVAFATIAGMPPEYGLYAAMVPAIVAALWGSSWQLVSGPTTAISIVVFATISPLAAPWQRGLRAAGADADLAGRRVPAAARRVAAGHAGQLRLAHGGGRFHCRRRGADRG